MEKIKKVLVKDFVEFDQIEDQYNQSLKRRSRANTNQFLAREVPCPLITVKTVLKTVIDEYVEE